MNDREVGVVDNANEPDDEVGVVEVDNIGEAGIEGPRVLEPVLVSASWRDFRFLAEATCLIRSADNTAVEAMPRVTKRPAATGPGKCNRSTATERAGVLRKLVKYGRQEGIHRQMHKPTT